MGNNGTQIPCKEGGKYGRGSGIPEEYLMVITMTNVLFKIMNEHFEAIEKQMEQMESYEDDLFVYHCLRDWGCSSEEIDRLCRPENREECDRILRNGV